jgi:phosphatidylinositol alpha-1,6-mannosyltransferase
MKTLLITLEYPPFNGGVASYYGLLVKYWPKTESIEVLDNNKGELFSGNLPLPWFKAVKTLFLKRKKKEFDYLLVGHILPLGTAAFLVSRFLPFKYSVVLHGLDFSSALKSKRKRLLTRLILKRSHKIICANSHVAYLVSEFNKRLKNKIVVQNPGIENVKLPDLSSEEKKDLRKKYNICQGDICLFSLGRLVLRKGFDKVIEALVDFPINNIKYLIAGVGEQEGYLKNLVKVRDLSDKVIFLGNVDENKKWQLLQLADIFIMPARQIGVDFEGFGIVYLEANLASKPVIAGISGGVKDAVVHNQTGLLLNPENIEAIREAILCLTRDQELRFKLGKNGRDRALRDFSWEKKAGQFLKTIKN